MILLPYPPSVNRVWRNFKGRTVLSPEGKAYKEHAAWICRSLTPLTSEVEVYMILHPRLTKEGKPSKTRLDCDNFLKVVLDSLNKIAFLDDSQVVRIVAEIGEPYDGGAVSVQVRET